MSGVLIGFVYLFGTLFLILLGIMLNSIKIIYQYERGVKFRLGKYVGTLKPGLNFVIPLLETMRKVDMRIKTIDIPTQEVMTSDNVPVKVNGVVYFKVKDPVKATIEIQDYTYAVSQYAQTALRDVVGGVELDEVLEKREQIGEKIGKIVDVETDSWGIDIEAIRMQDIELPAEMKRAMAAQAEAERERRAIIIKSEGEKNAAENLTYAAKKLASSPAGSGIMLRTLQTVSDIAADPSEKIVILLPTQFGELSKLLTETVKGKGK
ncbi:slipin family protein [Candidatus Micrarchaeota archaeon]|nr:slipin family protein [Candidatus Micrarchaeota archaeon]